MSKIVRWDPMREAVDLFNEFDRMLDVPRMRALMSNQLSEDTSPWGLAVDVSETDDQYKVEASVPGISPDDLNITLEDNVLTIAGEHRVESEVDEPTYHLRERRYGRFSRSLRFPTLVNADAVVANVDNGVLTLTVPKAEEVKPKRIAIQAGNGNK